MSVRSALAAVLRGRRSEAAADADGAAPPPAAPSDQADVQVFAHTLIAELFGAGLRIQNLSTHVPEELQPELEQVADQIDKALRDVRAFAFGHRGTD